MISQLIVLGSVGTISDPALVVTVLSFPLRSMYFSQFYGGKPPEQGATSFDLSPYVNLASITITTLGIVITFLGIVITIYLFYRGRAEKPVKVEKSVDPAINVLEIHRYPLEDKLWKAIKNRRKLIYYFLRIDLIYWGVLTAITLILVYLTIILFEAFVVIPLVLLAGSLFRLFIAIIAYQVVQVRYMELGATSEEGSRFVLDHAEMSVCADYNYLLAKGRWSLKQMEAFAITVNSNSIEGILRTPPFLSGNGTLKATIKADQGEKATFIIIVECSLILTNELIKGKYINRFLDLMGSNGFSPNPVTDI